MDCKHEDICPFFQGAEESIGRKERLELDRRNYETGKHCAFGNKDTEYYELLIDIGPLKKGAVFYYDPDDNIRGSIAAGCIKLAWTEDGDCYSRFVGNTFVMHANARNDRGLFERVVKHENCDT